MRPTYRLPHLHLRERGRRSAKVNRASASLGHAQATQMLARQAAANGVDHFCSVEELSTATCSACTSINHVGASKRYVCRRCQLEQNRDSNPVYNQLWQLMAAFTATKPTTTTTTTTTTRRPACGPPVGEGEDAPS
mmetsp:Transcript_10986/g.36082  ORF Transcript_10986/g.36082 Transcript_10986/m.36082 type:complete len:136 (-) Transcript_10986:255-662(-)